MFRPLIILIGCLFLSSCETPATVDKDDESGDFSQTIDYPAMLESSLFLPDAIRHKQYHLRIDVGDRVYFEYDSSELSKSAKEILFEVAKWMNRYPGFVGLSIEGHTDVRGSREYNLALAERRSLTVRHFLISLGIDPTRLRTVSYGKERPGVLGSNEEAWAQNRRVAFVATVATIPTPVTSMPVDVSVRAPLWAGKYEEPGFGLYSYLLFGSNSKASRPGRLAAARVYVASMQLSSDPTMAQLPRIRQNIFYVPLRYYDARAYAFEDVGSESLVCNYDYARARVILSTIGERGYGIFLVSHTQGLSNLTDRNDKKLLVWDISKATDYDLIELRLNEFRQQLRKVEFWDDQSLRKFMIELRELLRIASKDLRMVNLALGALSREGDIEEPSAPIPINKDFAVFFGFGSAQLSKKGTGVIEQAVAYASKLGFDEVQVFVIGRADRSGDPIRNAALANQRAEIVREALEDSGLPRHVITTRSYGEDNPIVPTSDGVAEPLNRIVEIRVTRDLTNC